MSDDGVNGANGAIGFLQKKNRFYGWNKCLFLLNRHGLALLSSDPLPRTGKSSAHQPELPFQIIGDVGGYDLRQVGRIRPKQLIAPADLIGVSAQGARDIVVTTASSGTLVLRAQAAADQSAWVQNMQVAIASAVLLDASHATSFADVPEFDNGLESAACHKLAVAIPQYAHYIPTLTMSSGLVSNSIGGKIGIALPELEVGLDSSVDADAEVSAIDIKMTQASCLGESAATMLPLSAAYLPDTAVLPPGVDEFNVSAFFDDDDSTDSSELLLLSTSAARSKNALYSRTQNFTSNPQAETPAMPPALPALASAVSVAWPAPPLTTCSVLTSTGSALGAASSTDFGSMFDFLRSPRTEPAPAHTLASLYSPAPTATPHSPQVPRQAETLPRESLLQRSVTQKQEVPAVAVAPVLGRLGSSNTRLQSTEYVDTFSRGLAGAGAAVGVAAKSVAPGVVLTPSIADFAGSLMDNMGLTSWSRSVEPIHEHAKQSQIASVHVADEHQRRAGAESTSQPAPAAMLLNSPKRHRPGGPNAENFQGAAPINRLDASAKRLTLDGSAVGLSGIQTALLSKYSDSLSSSRALLPGVGRPTRPKTAHDWHTKMGGPGGQHIIERSATLIQYEPVEPSNTGVNKVVRGQLAKDIILKEAKSKPVVRRMRRGKSETKVAPLKSIRLRLDGSIVGSHASITQAHDSTKRSLSYVVKDGLISGAGGHMEQRLGASLAASAGGGAGKDANAGVYGEFNEIRARLQMAEEHKRRLQQANLSDRDRADDVRIADIIENRQDISLAAQLEERRKVQLAKQQVLLQQQLAQQQRQVEQQRAFLEQQRAFLEQQQQHQLFKRQSLHPSLNSVSQVSVGLPAYAGQQGGWQGYGSNGSSNYADQWVQQQQQQGMYTGAMPTPYQFQPSHHSRTYQSGGARHAGSYFGASEQSCQSVDLHSGEIGRSSTTNPRLQPGAALCKAARPASAAGQSLHSLPSHVSSDSWQSRAAPSMGAAGIPARANTEINFDGSECCASPMSNAMPPRRTSSYGVSGHQRSGSLKPGSLPTRRNAKAFGADKVPPVPPLPHAGGGRAPHQEYAYPPPHGPPEYMPVPVHDQGGHGYRQQAYGSQWVAGQPRAHSCVSQHGPLPPSQAALSRHSAYVQDYGKQVGKDQTLADMQKLSKRRTEMAANTPSLLQRLDTARTCGILPGRHVEKLGYSQGAYQNQTSSRVFKDGSSAQYLGNGNTLLIDRVYESEKSRSAFLKKISRTYTGIGGDTAPVTTFKH